MHKVINLLKTSFAWQAGLLITLTALLYGSLINNLNLWADEIYSVLMAKDSLPNMWTLLLSEDSKPPLYYLYLKGILSLFPTQFEIWAAHFGSVLLLILAQIFAATVVRHDFGDKIALWLIALIMLMPQSLWLGFEVRTYMLSALLMTAIAVYGQRLLNHPKVSDFVKFGVCSVLALYTHYYCAIWMMFFYIGLLYFIIKDKKFRTSGRPFILTAVCVAIFFIPWLYVPLHNGDKIMQSWYVSESFVKFSWRFFINPLAEEFWQSSFFIATTLATAVFSFILLIGLWNIPQKKAPAQMIKLLIGSFVATYALLWVLSYTVRPIVTERYLKIFSLILYLAAAIILMQLKNIQKAFILVSIIGFIFTYADIRATVFHKGYQNLAQDIRQFIPKEQPLIAFDQSNLFCEYYLPEYTCLLIVGERGEYFRLPQVAKNIALYQQEPAQTVFGLSLYRLRNDDNCRTYDTEYRNGQNLHLCRYSRDEVMPMLEDSIKWLNNHVKTP